MHDATSDDSSDSGEVLDHTSVNSVGQSPARQRSSRGLSASSAGELLDDSNSDESSSSDDDVAVDFRASFRAQEQQLQQEQAQEQQQQPQQQSPRQPASVSPRAGPSVGTPHSQASEGSGFSDGDDFLDFM